MGVSNVTSHDAAQVALEYIKQIITLASGILALSGTFIEKLVRDISYHTALLPMAWVCLLVSVYFGLATISAIIKSKLDNDRNWSVGRGRLYATICKLTFVGGISVFLVFVSWSLMLQAGKPGDEPEHRKCIDRERHVVASLTIAGRCERAKSDRAEFQILGVMPEAMRVL